MNKIIEKLESWLMPLSAKLSNMKFLAAISETMQLLLPVIITGSFGSLLANAGIGAWTSVLEKAPVLKNIFSAMNTWTMGILSIYIVVVLAYRYSENLNTDLGIIPSALSLAAFCLITFNDLAAGMTTAWTGHKGMITAFIVAWAVTKLTVILTNDKLMIKLPDSVPTVVAKAFKTLIPGSIVILIFSTIGQLFTLTPYGNIHSMLYTLIQAPFQKVGLSLGGLLFAKILGNVSMFVGVHGSSTTSWYRALLQSASAANLEAYTAGEALPYVVDAAHFDLTVLGGIGSTLGLVIACLIFCKSKRIKEVAKVAIVPQLFNINEPILFGLPIMLNPIFFVPYILVTVVNTVIGFICVASGFIGHSNGVTTPWCLPGAVNAILTNTTPISAEALRVILLFIDIAIWLPFAKLQDKKYLEEENKSAE